MDKKLLYISTVPVGVVINIIGGEIASFLKIPLYLDSIGTILNGCLLGPIGGALTGLISNLVLGLISDPTYIPFALVNIVIGLISGYIAYNYGYSLKNAVILGIVLGIVCPIIGTPIAVYLFGGLTGGGVDFITALLIKSGSDILSAAFLARLPTNLVDKVLSAIIVYYIIKTLPPHIINTLKSGNIESK